MFFKRPEIEFISLSMEDVLMTGCAVGAVISSSGVETCNGDAPSNNCIMEVVMMHEWLKPQGDNTPKVEAKQVEAPKQVIGFDLTFDK